MDDQTISIILLSINTFLYILCFYMIIKRRKYSCISIRSPTLLLCNNIGGFFMTTAIILDRLLQEKTQYISAGFLVFQTLMMLSFFLRCQRIVSCCQINTDERYDKQMFYDKRYIFQEKYYIKIMLCGLALIIISLVISDCILKTTLTVNYFTPNKNNKIQTNLWLILNFIEQMIMLTYVYLMRVNEVKQKIQFELFTFLLSWFLYSNALTLFDYHKGFTDKDDIIQLAFSLFFLYICLFLNGYFPVILSYCYHTSISYHFSPLLMNNLYLFLSNEVCYGAFSDYLRESNQESDLFYLRLYTHIMKYKLEFMSEENQQTVVADEVKEIMATYFNKQKYPDQAFNDVVISVKKNASGLVDKIQNDIFDEALKFAYLYLGRRFVSYKKTTAFQRLTEKLTLNSYIQCKMCNTGLINKF